MGDDRIGQLYAEHSREACRVATLITGNRALAEDLVHEAFVKMLGRYQDLRRSDAFRSYLLKTVVNLTRGYFRRQGVEERFLTSERAAPEAKATLPNVEVRDELHSALLTLPPRQRSAVVLRYCEDLSEHQTAEMLGTSPKAVRSLVGRGLATLRERVERVES